MKIRLTKSFLYSLFLHGTIAVLLLALFLSSGGEEKVFEEKRCKVMLSQVCACVPEKSEPKPPVAERHKKPQPKKKVVKKERVEQLPSPVVKEEVVPEPVEEEIAEAQEEAEIAQEEVPDAADDAIDEEEVEEVVVAPDSEAELSAAAEPATDVSATDEMTPEEAYIKAHIAEIMSLLRKNLYYPRMARKRGIEGTVMVRFELLANGEINNITVLESERDILASATVTTIERMEGKFPLPSEPLLLNVPIVYALH